MVALAVIPAILFSLMHMIAPAMISIIAIWSIGLTLYLPWPIYALSLWVGTLIVVSALKRDQPIGWVLLLLLAAGYAPQVSTQVFSSVIALWLMLSGQSASEAKQTTPALQAVQHSAAAALNIT